MKYSIIILIVVLFSCNKENPGMEVIDTQVDVFVEDADGHNLLTGTSADAINTDSIKLMYLIDGNIHTVFNPERDCPRGVCYIADSGSERIALAPNAVEGEEYPITYIDWGDGDIDTLKCHFVRKDNGETSSLVCDKVWFNGSLMFPDNAITEFGRAFKIVK
jgi:hypothetical protein